MYNTKTAKIKEKGSLDPPQPNGLDLLVHHITSSYVT